MRAASSPLIFWMVVLALRPRGHGIVSFPVELRQLQVIQIPLFQHSCPSASVLDVQRHIAAYCWSLHMSFVNVHMY